MDEISARYKEGKFQKCLELIKLQPATDNLAHSFLLQNNSLICSSLISILENNVHEKERISEDFESFYKNVISVAVLSKVVPLHLHLTIIYNFYWWLLFHNDININDSKCEGNINLVNLGLCSVLGKNPANEPVYLKTPEKIIENLCLLKKLNEKEDSKTLLLILEIVAVVLAYLIGLKNEYIQNCISVSEIYVVDSVKISVLECFNEFFDEIHKNHIFKFGLMKIATVLNEIDSTSIEYLLVLKSAFLYSTHNYRDSLNSLQMGSKFQTPILNYLGALNAIKLDRKNLCLGFINQTDTLNMENHLSLRFKILSGLLSSSEGHHKNAVKHFMDALSVSNTYPAVYFYIGHQWGKMGLNDMMVEYFEKLLTVTQSHHKRPDKKYDFGSLILNWIHPGDEVTEREALYALAIAYGLNERFYEAADTFEKLLHFPLATSNDDSPRIIDCPNWLTVLHDASITNLLAGNLSKAEEIATSAVMRYQPQEVTWNNTSSRNCILGRDDDWLKKTIEEELLELDVGPREERELSLDSYPEELVYFLPEDVVALLILSEVQRIQKLQDEYTVSMRKIFSLFSNYLGKIVKREDLSVTERGVSRLMKAIAGKTCLAIAKMQMNSGNNSAIEKMLKRALSCNKGDKDILAFYCKFLAEAGRRSEASKLWNAFSEEKSIVSIESVQSLSLRYFLATNITVGELEKIQQKFDSITY